MFACLKAEGSFKLRVLYFGALLFFLKSKDFFFQILDKSQETLILSDAAFLKGNGMSPFGFIKLLNGTLVGTGAIRDPRCTHQRSEIIKESKIDDSYIFVMNKANKNGLSRIHVYCLLILLK